MPRVATDPRTLARAPRQRRAQWRRAATGPRGRPPRRAAPRLARPHVIANFQLFFVCFSYFPFFLETSHFESYHLFLGASTYNCLSNCNTHGYYILTTSCISRPLTSCSFRGLQSLQTNVENLETKKFAITWGRAGPDHWIRYSELSYERNTTLREHVANVVCVCHRSHVTNEVCICVSHTFFAPICSLRLLGTPWASLGLRCRNSECDALQLASFFFQLIFVSFDLEKKRAKHEARSCLVFRAPGVR